MTEHEIRLADGRILAVTEGGTADGPVVLIHHGTPSVGTLQPWWIDDAVQRGLRLVAYSRPGYASSTPMAGRRVADAATDAIAIMDALGVERFATWGISGGGPHALACAALARSRVVAVASLAGVAPFDAPGLNYFAGMGEDNLIEFGLAMAGQDALEPFCRAGAAEMAAAEPSALLSAMGALVSAPDRAALQGPLGEVLAREAPLSFAHGVEGWMDDDFAFLAPFGFAVQEIAVPALVVHGHQDRFVPLAHGRWLAGSIPGAEAWIIAGDGHLTLMTDRVPAVHAWLADRF